ncbi:unnamed protein product [Absidia cylindrospora]
MELGTQVVFLSGFLWTELENGNFHIVASAWCIFCITPPCTETPIPSFPLNDSGPRTTHSRHFYDYDSGKPGTFGESQYPALRLADCLWKKKKPSM